MATITIKSGNVVQVAGEYISPSGAVNLSSGQLAPHCEKEGEVVYVLKILEKAKEGSLKKES
jgi:hypothetical protein